MEEELEKEATKKIEKEGAREERTKDMEGEVLRTRMNFSRRE
jgi:hypothetical protein